MSRRVRLVLALVLSGVLVAGALVYGIVAVASYRARADAPSAAKTADTATTGDRIVFRNTASGQGYGLVSTVPLSDPEGARSIGSEPCDRVDESHGLRMCLRIDRGVVTTFTATLLAKDGSELRSWPLPGIPSRTRMSPDGTMLAFTAFVTGESYGSVAFSTQTIISPVQGADYGSLETWDLQVDGQRITAADRNFWGVTFADDDTFYATAASAGHTWLVKGSVKARTMTAIRDGVECPSLSPDGTRIAFKKRTASVPTPTWTVAVYDLATGAETVLPEKHDVDDQVEWLDDSTVLYGLAREGSPGDYDVWATAADGKSAPRLFLPHAWSPSVVRG
jgi:hypothetical protein